MSRLTSVFRPIKFAKPALLKHQFALNILVFITLGLRFVFHNFFGVSDSFELPECIMNLSILFKKTFRKGYLFTATTTGCQVIELISELLQLLPLARDSHESIHTTITTSTAAVDIFNTFIMLLQMTSRVARVFHK